MSSDLNTAFIVLIVGMTTVFFILSLVVFTGRLLIRIVNHYSPIPSPVAKVPAPVDHSPETEHIQPAKLAAIVAAVDLLSGGQAKIEKIEPFE
ncbi:MAG: OadG family protein [Bacteroidota bacterium]